MEFLEQLRQSRIITHELKLLIWQEYFLTFKWWFIAIVIVLSYAIWWKFTDKRRIIEILLFGSFIAVCRVIFDNWGITSGRWTYVIDLVPLGFSLFLNDLTVIPLSYMLAYQYSPTWPKYLIYIVILQTAISYAFMPLLTNIGILVIHNWSLTNTFVFMVTVAIIMRGILLTGLSLQKQAQTYSGNLTAEPAPQPTMKPLKDNSDDK